nr:MULTISPECIES: DUF3265 domain-containing protein [unclassified Vibrio]
MFCGYWACKHTNCYRGIHNAWYFYFAFGFVFKVVWLGSVAVSRTT